MSQALSQDWNCALAPFPERLGSPPAHRATRKRTAVASTRCGPTARHQNQVRPPTRDGDSLVSFTKVPKEDAAEAAE